VILAIERIEFHNKLEEWLPRQGYWRICWRASEHGWAASTFHRKCDGKVPTLTIVQVVKNNKSLVFGGYATRSWADADPDPDPDPDPGPSLLIISK
jgi:hypothetical protein